MNVHVFASSLPTSQHIHHQASILVHDADSSHKWFDIALPVLAPGELKPADVSDLDDFVHTAALGADASAPSLADARRSLSRQKSSLDPAASKVSSISLGPASPAHLSTELPSLPASQLALLSTTNNVSLNKIPPSRDTPLSDQLHMHNSSQSASRQPGGTPQSQQPHGTHKEQNNFHPTQSLADMTRDVSDALTTNPSLPPLPPNQQQLYETKRDPAADQNSMDSSRDLPVPRSSTPRQSFSLANQEFEGLFSQVEVAGDLLDTSQQDVSFVSMSPSQYRPYAPQGQAGSSRQRSQISSGFQNASMQFMSYQQAQARSFLQDSMSRDVSNASPSNLLPPPFPPNQGQLYAAQHSSRPQAQERPFSQDSLYAPASLPGPGRTHPAQRSSSSQGSQDSLYHSARDNVPVPALASSSRNPFTHQDDPQTGDSDETPPGLVSSSAHAVTLLLSRPPARRQRSQSASQESPPGLTFHAEPSFDPARSFVLDVGWGAKREQAIDAGSASHSAGRRLRGDDEQYQGDGPASLLNHDTAGARQKREIQCETALRAQTEDVGQAHNTFEVQRSNPERDNERVLTHEAASRSPHLPFPRPQPHLSPPDGSLPSVHWPQILGHAPHSQPAPRPLSPFAPPGSQPSPSQIAPSSQAQPLNSQALLALSLAPPNSGGSQPQDRSASPVPSAYLPTEEAHARMTARAAWGTRYDEVLERAYGRAAREGMVAGAEEDPYAEGYGLDGSMEVGQGDGGGGGPHSNSTQRLLSQSASGSQNQARTWSQESLPARVSQVLGMRVPVSEQPQTAGSQRDRTSQHSPTLTPPAVLRPVREFPQEQKEQEQEHEQPDPPQLPQSQAYRGNPPMQAHSQRPLPEPAPGPSRIAEVPLTGEHPPTPHRDAAQETSAGAPPPDLGSTKLKAVGLKAARSKLKASSSRKLKGPPPFAFIPCLPPRDPPELPPSPGAELGQGHPARLPNNSGAELPQEQAKQAQTQRIPVPAVVPPSLRLPRQPSLTIVPDSQEERDRREREAREKAESELMREWNQLKEKRRVRIEDSENVGWTIPQPHEWPVPTRVAVVIPSVPSVYLSSQEESASIVGSLPTDPERFYEERDIDERQYKQYHNSQQCTQEQWPVSQQSAAQREDVEMDIDGVERSRQADEHDMFTNPNPLYYGFPDNTLAEDVYPRGIPLPDPTPRAGDGKKQSIIPVPHPVTPYTRASAESFLRSPYGRCAWVIPIRGCLGFGCSPASMLVQPDLRFAVTPCPMFPPSDSCTPPEPDSERESWTERFGVEKLRAALHALPQLLASSPATTGSFQDAPGEVVWTVDALRGFWEFLLLLRRASRVGLVGVHFVEARTSPGASEEDEDVRMTRGTLRSVDHILLELDARYAMTVRYLLHVWRYECTMSADIVALRCIHERPTGLDGGKEKGEKGKEDVKGKGKERENAPDVEMDDDTPEGRGTKRKRADSLIEEPAPRSFTGQGRMVMRKARTMDEKDAEKNLERAVTPLRDVAKQPQLRKETRQERMKRKNRSSRRMFHGARLLLLDEHGRAALTC